MSSWSGCHVASETHHFGERDQLESDVGFEIELRPDSVRIIMRTIELSRSLKNYQRNIGDSKILGLASRLPILLPQFAFSFDEQKYAM